MTDCSSIQGSSTSSSSDVMTLTTASSWCAIPTSSRIRVLRLMRPHIVRRILVTPDSNPSFGFAVRGGKEFGTGFFVSNVDRNSEADLKGLRIGDQILRINGFRVDDAVHKEFIQFVTSQDRITLKVRGVGMLPMKDKENDQLSWHVVKISSVSNTPSESSYKSTIDRDTRRKDINIVLNVAPRTKLGLGICKGPEWKPGIFVQFTKDKSVARESGLRPGDQILSVNSIDFSDVLFSEAVAVMKGSSKLEMVVRTAAGLDLFPGESSGYNSSASSVTGDQSPCWADAKSKRLTAVREEPPIGGTNPPICWNEPMYAEPKRSAKTSANGRAGVDASSTKEVNKTIIKLSENGTSINNTYIANPNLVLRRSPSQPEPSKLSTSYSLGKTCSVKSSMSSSSTVPPPPPLENLLLENSITRREDSLKCSTKLSENGLCSRPTESKTVIVDVHRNALEEGKLRKNGTLQRIQSVSKLQDNKHYEEQKSPTQTRTANDKLMSGPPIAPAYSNFHNMATNKNRNNSFELGGSTLSSAITEELKKRKEKQQLINGSDGGSGASAINNLIINNNSQNNCTHKMSVSQYDHQPTTLRQVSKRTPSSGRATSSTANCSERNSNSSGSGNGVVCGSGAGGGGGSGADQHSALMDEFKRAHRRMFKNGFHESERKERRETLKRTTMMEDDVNYRSSRVFPTETKITNDNQPNGNGGAGGGALTNGQPINIPPPPPQFANSPPQEIPSANNLYKASQKSSTTIISTTSTSKQSSNGNQTNNAPRPPSSPVPDYDNVQSVSASKDQGGPVNTVYGYTPVVTTNTVTNSAGNRRTMRLGTVTIGEYDHQRKDPTKFDFINSSSQKSPTPPNQPPESLRSELQNTLSRSNLKKTNNGNLEHQSNCPLQSTSPQGYENVEYRNGSNVENLARKLQGASIMGKSSSSTETATITLRNGNGVASRSSSNGSSNGTGILKNGSRNSGGSFTKTTEKTLTFGN